MKPESINDIYQKVDKSGCFRIRNVNNLEDWAVGQRFDWSFCFEKLTFVTGYFLDSKECITTMRLDASRPDWVLLSTKREMDYLQVLPPMQQWQRLKQYYVIAKLKNTGDGYF